MDSSALEAIQHERDELKKQLVRLEGDLKTLKSSSLLKEEDLASSKIQLEESRHRLLLVEDILDKTRGGKYSALLILC